MKLAVIGDPVTHSKSPQIHAGFLRAAGIEGTYDAIRVPAGGVAEAVVRLRDQGYLGLNVTTPLKEEAYAVCTALDEVAQQSGSVNTITLSAHAIAGANTDGVGASEALESALHATVEGKDILLLGAGPTARAAAFLLRGHARRVYLWNRTNARAAELAARFDLPLWYPDTAVDAVLSTLPPYAEMEEALIRALRAAPVVVDANYGARATLGAALGRDVVDGEQWLLAQARASFAIWRAAIDGTLSG